MLVVEKLKPNLLSGSQTWDQGHILIFYSKKCEIRKKTGKLVATTTRTPSDVYILNTEKIRKMSHESNRWKFVMA